MSTEVSQGFISPLVHAYIRIPQLAMLPFFAINAQRVDQTSCPTLGDAVREFLIIIFSDIKLSSIKK